MLCTSLSNLASNHRSYPSLGHTLHWGCDRSEYDERIPARTRQGLACQQKGQDGWQFECNQEWVRRSDSSRCSPASGPCAARVCCACCAGPFQVPESGWALLSYGFLGAGSPGIRAVHRGRVKRRDPDTRCQNGLLARQRPTLSIQRRPPPLPAAGLEKFSQTKPTAARRSSASSARRRLPHRAAEHICSTPEPLWPLGNLGSLFAFKWQRNGPRGCG